MNKEAIKGIIDILKRDNYTQVRYSEFINKSNLNDLNDETNWIKIVLEFAAAINILIKVGSDYRLLGIKGKKADLKNVL